MSLLKLKLIVLIDRYKQVTAVAKALQIKQPTVSFHMKKMEEEWGVKLFETRTGKVLLTPHGKMMLHYASQIDELYKEATMKLAMISETEKKRLVIGCTESAGEWFVKSGALSRLGKISDKAKVSVALYNQDELFQKLGSGLVDLALSGEHSRHEDSSEWRHQLVRSSRLALLAPNGHPVLEAGSDAARKLHDHDFVELSDSSVVSSVRAWSRQAHHFLQPNASFGSVPLLLQAIAASGSLAILPECLLPADNGLMQIKLDGAASWHIHASWRHSYWDQAMAADVVSLLSEEKE